MKSGSRGGGVPPILLWLSAVLIHPLGGVCVKLCERDIVRARACVCVCEFMCVYRCVDLRGCQRERESVCVCVCVSIGDQRAQRAEEAPRNVKSPQT